MSTITQAACVCMIQYTIPTQTKTTRELNLAEQVLDKRTYIMTFKKWLYYMTINIIYAMYNSQWDDSEKGIRSTWLHMPCNRLYNKRLLTLQDQWRQNKINIAGARRAWSQNGWAGVLGEGQYCGKCPAHQQGVWRSTVKAPTMGSELRCMLGSLGELLSCSPAMQNGV